MAKRRLITTVLALGAAATLAVVLLAGCGYMRVIRTRVPPPTRKADGMVVFRYEAPQARHVNLCGNWNDNDWCGTRGTGRFDHDIGAMHDDDGDGIWEIEIYLEPGRYEYKYSVDWGVRWEQDPNNPVGVDDGFGGQNSILILR
jgi:1,4-alpha-glucan branching enzyme